MDYPPCSFPTFCSILSLQSFHPALVIKIYPTNLQGSFLMCIVRSHIRFCLYIFVFTLPTTLFNKFTQPNISFLLSTIIFINQTCLFASISFQPVLSTLSFFFRNHFLSQQPSQPIFFLFNHFIGFPCLHHPPPAIFFWQDFPFPLFSLESLGGSHVEESNCPFLGFALPMSRFQIILLRVELYVMLKVMYPNCEIYTVYRRAFVCLLLAPSKVVTSRRFYNTQHLFLLTTPHSD